MQTNKRSLWFVTNLFILVNLIVGAAFIPGTSGQAAQTTQDQTASNPTGSSNPSTIPIHSSAKPYQPQGGQYRIAYIYDTDTAARDSYSAFLTGPGYGYAFDAVKLSAVPTYDFSVDFAIIIGADTGTAGAWGNPAAVAHVIAANRQVIGVFEGGSSFFQVSGLFINYGQSWFDNGNSLAVVDPSDPTWGYPFPVPTAGNVQVYTNPNQFLAVYNPAVVAGVTRIGRQVNENSHYPLISEKRGTNCYTLWGFSGLPEGMTADGKNAFVNALYNQTCGLGRVAYIYNQDTASRDSFKFILNGAGLSVDLVTVSAAETFDFSNDLSIIVGDDTGYLNVWGTAAAVAHVSAAEKPVVGVGEGGYAYFGQLSLAIGFPSAAHGPENDMGAIDPTMPLYMAPYPITIPPSNILNLYAAGVPTNAIFLNWPTGIPAGVTLIGSSISVQGDYHVASQTLNDTCNTLWGYSGSPATMTLTGQNLFVNLVLAQPCGCTVQLIKTVSPAGAANPGDVVNYSIQYAVVGTCRYQRVRVIDILPVEVNYLPGSATPPAVFGGGALIWDLGDLLPGASGTLKFQALVNNLACSRQHVIQNRAELLAVSPAIDVFSDIASLEVLCRPVNFPNNNPPYAESEITVEPYPLVTGQLTTICTTIHNSSAVPQTVNVLFSLANFGMGIPFTPIVAAGNPRTVVIPPGGNVTVCIFWTPVTPGHQCVQIQVSSPTQVYTPIYSQRNLDVDEVLVPGKLTSFTVPVMNSTGAPVTVAMVLRNNCPGWTVNATPATFPLGNGASQDVTIDVTPPTGAVLGSGCTIDIEAWVVDKNGDLIRLLGGIRKIDNPTVPLGPPGDVPFAQKEIRIAPYPLVSGQLTQVCVSLTNNTGAPQTVTAEFQLSTLGIGLAFNTIPGVSGPNPQTVVIPPHSTIDVCIKFIPSTPGHHCLAVKLTLPDGYVTYSRQNLDVSEVLHPQVPTDVIIPVGNPTSVPANIDLVVDNTCPGWTASVTPTTLYGVLANDMDVRNVTLTVTPPPGLLGTGCHIDLMGYINGILIGGVRKIDRPPLAPPIQEPHYAESEISVNPVPPVVGQPTQVCATINNPTDTDQVVSLTFNVADFGAGIGFTPLQTVGNVVVPATGSKTVCITWVPAAGGTLHRCIQVQIHQDGYYDIYSQRNVDLVHFNLWNLFNGAQFINLPNFLIHNPGPDPEPFTFLLQQVGVNGLQFLLMDHNGKMIPPGTEIQFGAGETQSFFLQVRQAALTMSPSVANPTSPLSGSESYVDVIPYANGQPVIVDGNQSALRFAFDTPLIYMPFITR